MKVIARGRVKGGTSVRGLAQHKANSLNNGDEAKPSTYAYVLNIYIYASTKAYRHQYPTILTINAQQHIRNARIYQSTHVYMPTYVQTHQYMHPTCINTCIPYMHQHMVYRIHASHQGYIYISLALFLSLRTVILGI
jgi:hypothetical protein